jgi:hypothetical protein
MKAACLLALVGALSCPAFVIASPVEYRFTGAVTSYSGPPILGITPQVGDPISGQFRYETEVTDIAPHPAVSRRLQLPPSYIEVLFQGVRFSNAGVFDTFVRNDVPEDAIWIGGGGDVFNEQLRINDGDAQFGSVVVRLVDDTGSLWQSDALPTTLSLPSFTQAYGQVSINDPSSLIYFSLDSLQPVPEPASGLLMAIVAGAALTCRGKKRFRSGVVNDQVGIWNYQIDR